MKKITCIILSLTIAFFSFSCISYADDESITDEPVTEDEYKTEDDTLNYLVLGDSIAYGFGVLNPHEACYGRIIADTNGYSYFNYSDVGVTSEDLLLDLDYMHPHIINADIISISIGGNDYFNQGLSSVIRYALIGLTGINTQELDKTADNFYNNFCEIIDVIREDNPDALILMQTIGNTWHGIGEKAFGACTDRLNEKIEEYASDHPGEIEIVDVAPVMSAHKEYVAADTVHPNAAGNVAIAESVQEKLVELGYAGSAELVINNPGIDYNWFDEYIGYYFHDSSDVNAITVISDKILAKVATVVIHSLTGYPISD